MKVSNPCFAFSWLRTFVVFSLSLAFSPRKPLSGYCISTLLQLNCQMFTSIGRSKNEKVERGQGRNARKTWIWIRHLTLDTPTKWLSTTKLSPVPFSSICHDLGLCSGLFRRCPFARGGRYYYFFFYWYINYQEGLVRRFLSTLGVCYFSFSDLSFLCLPQRRRRLGEKKKKKRKRNFLAFARPFAPWSSLCLVPY